MKILLHLFLLTTATLVFSQEWQLIKESDSIQIYKDTSGPLDMYKGETILDGQIDDVTKALYTFENYIKWIDECSVSERIDTSLETEAIMYGYSINKTPWPLKDIDNYFRLEFKKLASNKVEIHFESLPDFKPRNNKYTRLEISNGSWSLEQKGNQVYLTYYSEFEMPIKLPPFIVNNALKKSAFTLISGVKSEF